MMRTIKYLLSTLLALGSSTATAAPVAPKTEVKLELMYREYCPYCKKVFSHFPDLKEHVRLRELSKDEDALIKLKKLGGKTQVPCLMIDDEPLYESDDIIKWLKTNL